MKLLLLAFFCLSLSGCSRSDSVAHVQETKTKSALASVLLYGRVAAIDPSVNVHDMEGLVKEAQVQGQVAVLNAAGRSNISFNPDFQLWASTNKQRPVEFAVVLKGFKGHYLAIRFDGTLVETQHCRLDWVQ